MATEKGKKKGFDFKMSKKVAELTQVVHMLFTRNHEREVEIQFTKDLYNKELDRIHAAYTEKITSLETKLKSLSDKLNSDLSEEVLKTKVDQALLELESKWSKKFDSKESQYLTEKTNNVALKEMLTRLEQELSLLRTNSNDSSIEFNTQLASKAKEVDRLHKQLSVLDQKYSDQRAECEQLTFTLQNTLSQHKEDSQNLRSMLSESQLNEASASKKLQQVELELKSLKKEMTRKSSIELTNSRRSASIPTSHSQGAEGNVQEMHEELEHLRKLVQKYRLELSNREGNFNRMFTEKVPVHVDQRSMRSLAALSVKPRSNRPTEAPPDTDKGNLNQGMSSRSSSSMSNRRSMSLTGIRRSIAPPGGKQLLAQYNQQPNFKT